MTEKLIILNVVGSNYFTFSTLTICSDFLRRFDTRRSPCGRDMSFFPIALWWLYWRLYVFLNDDPTIWNWIGHRFPSIWSRVLRHHYKLSSLKDSSVSELLSIASFEKVLTLQKHPELFITSARENKMDNNCPLNYLIIIRYFEKRDDFPKYLSSTKFFWN